MNSRNGWTLSRRDFLKAGGALVVTSALPASSLVEALAAVDPFPPLDPTQLATWLAVKADGTVIARSGHVELGQGNQTALAQIVAEELDVPFARVSMVLGDTRQTPDQGVTAGSTTIRLAGLQLRQIAAEGRAALLKLASERLGVPADQLRVNDGVVSAGSRHVSYAELVKGKVLTAVAPISVQNYGGFGMRIVGTARPKDPSTYTIVGKRIPRVDVRNKVLGKPVYVQDVRVPGMLHARVIHPRGIGSTLVSVGSPSVPGVRVVTRGNLVAVLAEREWDAIKAAQSLPVTWSEWSKLPSSDAVYGVLRTLPTRDKVQTNRGDVDAALRSAAQTLSATYQTPFENHGMLGPSCAVADVRSDGSVRVWSATQYPQGLQRDVAQLLGISPDRVEVLRAEGPGCYGRLSANYDDAATEAVVLSQAVGRPVRVQWMRADEHIWEPHGPGTVHDLTAGLDGAGNVVAWKHEAWMPTNSDSTELGAALSGKQMKGTGIGTWTGPNLYTFPNALDLAHGLPELAAADSPYGFGLRTTYLRSPGQYQITFAQEAFVDEIAARAGSDPLEFRLRHLTDPRAIAVLQAAAKAAGWSSRPSPQPGASARTGGRTGQGTALVLRDGTYAAAVARVSVDPATGKVSVQSVTVAQDAGQIINPTAVEHQIESAVLQTTSRALLEEVTFDGSNVTSVDWSKYPILTMADAPRVQAVLIDHPEIPPTGVGEASVNVVAPAIANAVFDATGVRIRTLPLRADRVKAALQAGA
ncbi:MAG TPA: molybdopterin cofactor-binding domain-containing protein [Candidatus Dormibacteraeota bacterium]|nr:molybdopterin cofactor-binding domain-containing protein [Candidatus Dormibacteraeota bacterium]